MATVRSGEGVTSRLEEQTRDLRAALEEAEEAICRIDLQGRILAVNRAWSALFGSAPQTFTGQPWEQSVFPADRPLLHADLDASHPVRVERDVRGVRSDGSVIEMHVKVVPLLRTSPSGAGLGARAGRHPCKGHYLYIRDLTERRLMEGQLIIAGRMAAVGTLAAGVAHEINNPLAYILANLDFSRQQMLSTTGPRDEQDDPRMLEEITDALAEARQGAERVRNIVRDLRVFARGDEDARGPVALRRVLDSSINMAWNEIRHRARLVKDYGDVPMVEGNESRLGQVFLNLLLNAAQAIEEGQAERNEIRVTTRTATDGWAVVEVRDTGRGIPEALQARIFDSFFTTKSDGEGTGLGLWICRGILDALGGRITVKSEEGRGSVFCVTLPVTAIDAAAQRMELAAPDADRQGGRLLIVDDEPMILGALRRALAPDYAITCVPDGRAALATLRAGERYDIILCDLMMPELTGMDLFEEMRGLTPDQTERVIFVTGGAFTPRAREFLNRVPNARLEKPIDFQNLRLLIRNILR